MVCDLWLDMGFEVVMYDMPIFFIIYASIVRGGEYEKLGIFYFSLKLRT
jgi:hypothetical protein